MAKTLNEIDWDAEYKKETGNYSTYTRDDAWNAGCTHDYYCDEYIEWLEDKLNKATQQLIDNEQRIK